MVFSVVIITQTCSCVQRSLVLSQIFTDVFHQSEQLLNSKDDLLLFSPSTPFMSLYISNTNRHTRIQSVSKDKYFHILKPKDFTNVRPQLLLFFHNSLLNQQEEY